MIFLIICDFRPSVKRLCGVSDGQYEIQALFCAFVLQNKRRNGAVEGEHDSLFPQRAERVEKDKPVFEEFYANDFKLAQRFCGYNAKAAEVVSLVKQLGLRVCLATNPLFPHIATETRIGWAGLNKEDFELVTTYENCHYCKPNAGYYSEILATIGEKPENCLMVGNDAHEDTVPESLGMQVFVLTDCLINRQNAPLTWPHGGFDELEEHIKSLAGRG